VGGIRTTVHTADEVINAIKGSAGIKTTIAKRLNVARKTVDAYIERWSTVKEAYLTEKAGIDDAAQSVVINDILQNRSVETAKWWLRVKCAEEFSPKETQEITGTKENGYAIPIAMVQPGYMDKL
jgi:IS30 family transposase